LSRDAGSGGIIPFPQVYAISALDALRRGDPGFDRLMRRIGKKMEEIEMGKAAGVAGEISARLERIADPARLRNVPERGRLAARRFLEAIQRQLKTFS
jgi:hypothetical protein